MKDGSELVGDERAALAVALPMDGDGPSSRFTSAPRRPTNSPTCLPAGYAACVTPRRSRISLHRIAADTVTDGGAFADRPN